MKNLNSFKTFLFFSVLNFYLYYIASRARTKSLTYVLFFVALEALIEFITTYRLRESFRVADSRLES